MVCLYFGFFFQILPLIVRHPVLDIIPFNWIGVIWLAIGLMLVYYRGKSTGYWIFLDFPIRGTVNSIKVDKMVAEPGKLYKTAIEGLLKTKDGNKYYQDPADSALFSAGHESRIIKDGVNHTLNLGYVLHTKKLDDSGVHSTEDMMNIIKSQMIQLKDTDEQGKENGKYLLTGTEQPMPYDMIDLENNPMHKEVFSGIAKQWGTINGTGVSFDHYKKFLTGLGSATQMSSLVHYIKSDAMARAMKVKKGMGLGSGWKIGVVLVVVVIVIVILAMILMGGGLPEFTP